MTVAITRLDLTEADLRGAAARTQDAGRPSLAADAGDRAVAGRLVARVCGGGLRHGSPDAAGLGTSLQCLWAGRAVQPGAPQRATASPFKRTRGHGGGLGGARS